MSRPLRILVSAGEASGDRLGAGLARALTEASPGIEVLGMGGDEMEEAGVRLIRHASDVAVVGIVEVVRHLPAIRSAMRALERVLEDDPPDLFVPIDFPDFNLRLAERAKRAGVPIVYFVSPQIWAWRRGRVRTIGRLVRRVLVLFPFEEAFYRQAGVPVTFVGHPAAAGARTRPPSREAVLDRLGFPPGSTIVALMPGSRRGEVERHLPVLLEAASRLQRARPSLAFVVPRARTLPEGLVERIAAGRERVRVHRGDYPELLGVCAAGAVASGTATLDAAIAGLPIVVVYRMQPGSYLLARRLVRVEHIAMPNLIAGRRLVPELVQGEVRPSRVADEIGRLLDDPPHAARVRAGLDEVRVRLQGDGAYERAAAAILEEVAAGR